MLRKTRSAKTFFFPKPFRADFHTEEVTSLGNHSFHHSKAIPQRRECVLAN